MLMLSNIFLKYGDRVLLDQVSASIGLRDKVGLTGLNGAGKSTLLKIIAGEIRPDEGQIQRPNNSELRFLHQEMAIPKGRTVKEEALQAFKGLEKLNAAIGKMETAIAEREDYESDSYLELLDRHQQALHRYQLLGGQTMEADTEKVLKGLGFRQSDFTRKTEEFSGGWQMRIELTKMLLSRPDFLLLDEPTNHLDIESIIWLETFLKDYPGCVIVISHDREFLDRVTNRTLEIELGNLFDYKAPYSRAMDLREERREKQMAAFKNQQKVIEQKERTIKRFMAKATKTSMAQSMQKQLDKMERIEVEEENSARMRIRFQEPPRSGTIVLEGRDISKSYGPIEVLRHVDLKIERGERIAFVGQNGQGKTTLARILVSDLQPSGGEVISGHNVHLGYYKQDQSDSLDTDLTVLQTLEEQAPGDMRTRVRAILGAFLFSGEDVDKKVKVLSGGERARLALASLMLKPYNLLVLDEPTNHLDMRSKEVLKSALEDFAGTLIVVSHDRSFLAGLTDKTLEFRDQQLHTYLGDVNYFLEKRKLDNMREVEKGNGHGSTAADSNAAPKVDWEERKKRQRTVQQIETRIEKLEASIAAMEQEMADPEFYQAAEAEKKMRTYAQWKEELETAIGEWEKAQALLDEI